MFSILSSPFMYAIPLNYISMAQLTSALDTSNILTTIILMFLASVLLPLCTYELIVNHINNVPADQSTIQSNALPRVLPSPKAKGFHSPLPIILDANLTDHQKARRKAYRYRAADGCKIYSLKDLTVEHKLKQLLQAELNNISFDL